MNDVDELYAELRPDIESLAEPLFEVSDGFVRKRGAFLPHGAVLNANGETRMVMAAPPGFEDRPVSSTEVLPLLHEALRAAARDENLQALAVCEDVTIAPEGEKSTRAIKILVEHRRGLCVALYLPYRRKLLGGYNFGGMFVKPASAELCVWGDVETS